MKYIKNIPMAVSGLALSLASLGNLLRPHSEAIRYTCGILSAAILLAFILKVLLFFEHTREELKNPSLLSVLPTSTMSVMVLCTYIKPYSSSLAVWLWCAATIIQLCIMLLFIKRFVCNFDINNVSPSWFVVGGGIATASVAIPAMEVKPIGQTLLCIGIALYFLTLPVIIFRMVKRGDLPEPLRPTIAIFTAPMSMFIVGYFSAFDRQNVVTVVVMLVIAVVSYIYVSINMVFLLRLKFYPTYTAFAFPYVISAIAFRQINTFLDNRGIDTFAIVSRISEWLAVAVVVYVLIRYIVFFARAFWRGKVIPAN